MPKYAIKFIQHFEVEADSMKRAKEMIVNNPHDAAPHDGDDECQTYVGWSISGTVMSSPGSGTVIERGRKS